MPPAALQDFSEAAIAERIDALLLRRFGDNLSAATAVRFVWETRIKYDTHKDPKSCAIQVKNNVSSEILDQLENCQGKQILEVGAATVHLALLFAICGATEVICQDMAQNFREQAVQQLKDMWTQIKASRLVIPAEMWLGWTKRLKIVQSDYSGRLDSPGLPQTMIPPTYHTIIMAHVLPYHSVRDAELMIARAAGELLPGGQLVLAVHAASSGQSRDVLQVCTATTINTKKLVVCELPAILNNLFGYAITVRQQLNSFRGWSLYRPETQSPQALPNFDDEQKKVMLDFLSRQKCPLILLQCMSVFEQIGLAEMLQRTGLACLSYRPVPKEAQDPTKIAWAVAQKPNT